MKKLLAICTALLLSFSLVACSGNKSGEQPKESLEGKEEVITDDTLMDVETNKGTLAFPARYKDYLVTSEKEENNIDFVEFSANIEGKEYPLFVIMICEDEGDSIGTIKGKDGVERNVFVDIHELGDISKLNENYQDIIYGMQESSNIIADNLAK